MRRPLLACSAALLLPLALTGAARADVAPPEPCTVRRPERVATGSTLLADQHVVMSDGTPLALDVHLPTGVDGPLPAVVSITGYGKGGPMGGGDGGFTSLGYASVVVDDRGTGASRGQWDSWGERTQGDYAEVLDWVVAQPWSDGTVALTGASYGGITALFAAATGHPAVRAVFATVPMGDAYRDIALAGGQVNASFVPAWMGLVTALGVVNAGDPTVLADHLLGIAGFQAPTLVEAAAGGDAAYDGPFWRQRSPLEVVDRIQAPTFVVGGLDDLFQRGEPMLYEALADHTDARLLLGPWTHLDVGTGLAEAGLPSIGDLRAAWFDHHVRGRDTGVECIPPVTQFLRGADTYRTAPSWPVPDLTAARWHLRGDGGLTPDPPAAGEPGRLQAQLPITGLCTRSMNQWFAGAASGTACASDNRLDEALSLTYTSAPFDAPTEINGPIQADVWVVPTGPEALLSVAVSDVAPDGTSRGLTNGLLAASHRAVDPDRARLLDGRSIQPWHPFGEADVLPVVPGEPVLLPIEVFPTSAVLQPGHRLRVTVAAFDVPHVLPPVTAAVDVLAGPAVTVLSDADHPSSIVVPVVEPEAAPPPSTTTTATTATATTAPAPAPPTQAAAAAAPAATAADLSGAEPVSSSRPAVAGMGAALVAAAGVALARLARRAAG